MGMTQEQLTSMLDLEGGVKVGQSYISELERGDTYPSGQLLKALAIVLKTTTDFLVLLTEDPMLPARRDEDVLIVHLDSPESAAEIEELCALVQSTPSDRRKTLISFLRTFTLA
jgi:transcriptional regulator with XRE-family HTH domain